MPEDIIDENTDSAASTESTETGASEEVVKEGADTTTAQPSKADLDKGFADAVKQGFEKATSEEPEGTEVSEDLPEGVTATEKVDEKKEPEKKGVEKEGPVPYSRFKEVNEAKNQLEQQLEGQKSFVEAQKSIGDFCLNNNISNDEFSFWLNIAAKVKNAPEEALKLLQPHFQQLQSFQGEVLPPDLQKSVDDGEISLKHAQRLAAAENKSKFTQQQTKLSQEQIQQREVQRFQYEVQTSMHTWAKSKMATDPDFKPKESEDAEDGKFEFVQNKLAAGYQGAKLTDVASIVAFAEKVYESVNKSLGKFKPHPALSSSKVKSTNNGATPKNGAPESFEEAMTLGARKAGVNFTLPRK